MPGGEHDPQRLPQPALAGIDLNLARERLPRGADRVDLIVLSPTAGTLDAVDLHHVFTGLGQETRQPGAVVPGALQRPHPRSGSLLLCPAEHLRVAGGVRGLGQVGADPGAGGVEHGEINAVTVGVAPDDVVVLFCQHGHRGCPFPRAAVSTPAWEEVTVAAAL